VIRGGSWNNEPRNVRSANRNRNAPDERNNNLGFRLAHYIRVVEAIARSGLIHGSGRCGTRMSMSPFPGLARKGAPNRFVREGVARGQ
jgi:hypothetical protein